MTRDETLANHRDACKTGKSTELDDDDDDDDDELTLLLLDANVQTSIN